MKGFGILLAVIGIVAFGMGIYGFIELSNTGLSGRDFDAAAGIADAAAGIASLFGVTVIIGTEESLWFWIVKNRFLLTFGGAIVAVVGWLIRRNSPSRA